MCGEVTPNRYYQNLGNYQAAQLLFEAIKLDVFSYLDVPVTVKAVAAKTSYHERNLELLFMSLSSCGYIDQQNEYYCNTAESRQYLSKQSPLYLGEILLFREKMTSLRSIGDQVRGSFDPPSNLPYDFASLAELSVPEMYATGRVSGFLKGLEKLFPNTTTALKVLDLGGGSGILAMECSKRYPACKSFVFEHPDVINVTQKMILTYGMEKNVSVLSGDFMNDDFGDSYDLVVASGILEFATAEIDRFMKKISVSLQENGYLLLVGRYAATEAAAQHMMPGWLSGYMSGISIPPSQKEINQRLEIVNLRFFYTIPLGQFEGVVYQKQTIFKGEPDEARW